MNSKKRSGSLKSRYRKSTDFEGSRYSSMRRRPNYASKKEYFGKRSTSMTHSHSLSRIAKKNENKKKTDLDNRINEMMMKFKSKEYNEAITCGETILKMYPNHTDAYYIVGLSASMLDQHQKTIQNFEKLVALEPKYKKTVYLFLSLSFKKLGDKESGISILDKAVKHFPKFYEAYVSFDPFFNLF
jgi:tetratricopeptide (TPR) repeat protein